jgi:hypothetical protein
VGWAYAVVDDADVNVWRSSRCRSCTAATRSSATTNGTAILDDDDDDDDEGDDDGLENLQVA